MLTQRMPTGLKTAGKAAWKVAQQASHLEDDDFLAVKKLCQLEDKWFEYESHFKDNERLLWINNNTNLVLHPYEKRIAEVEKQLESLYQQLGLTPMGRSKMGLLQTTTEDDPFARFEKGLKELGKN